VAGVREARDGALAEVELIAELHPAQALERALGVLLGVERQRGVVLGEALAVRVGGVLLLQVPAVGQQQPAQLLRRVGAVPLHHAAGTFGGAHPGERGRAGGAQAQDAVARRNDAPWAGAQAPQSGGGCAPSRHQA
jgi:hypothetical protein